MTAPFYTVKRSTAKRPAVMARLFVVTGAVGARCMERKSFNSPLVATLARGALFHGELSGEWVARLPSEGGGYCFYSVVREVE